MRRTRRILTYGVFILTVVCAAWLYGNRQYVADQLLVWQYTPSSDVQALVKESGMSDRGKFDFYTGEPTIEGSQLFNQLCTRQEKRSAILGCYSNQKIYIYDVTDSKLAGIKSVTAAHEMLHAAYERLGDDEKQRVDDMLDAQYKSIHDAELTKRMEYYRRAEPNQRLNELHSILGTEFTDLSPKLETYYKTYFTNRKKVTSLHDSYAKVFRALNDQSDDLVKQLTSLKKSVSKQRDNYNEAAGQLKADVDSFNNRTENGSFTSQAEFNARRAQLVARSNQLDSERGDINGSIKRFNTLQKDLTAINTRAQALNESIDSSLAPAPSI